MNEIQEFGKLISSPNMKEVRKYMINIAIGPMFLGIVVFSISLRTIITNFDSNIDELFILVCFLICGIFLFLTGHTFLKKGKIVQITIYEQGFVDVYYDAGNRRVERVRSYFVENNELFGFKENGEKIRIIRRTENGMTQRIFNEIISDMQKGSIL